MVTLGVAAILLMIAVPSFHNVIISSRLTTTANAMAEAINLARMDAIKLNAPTQFCGNTAATNTADTLGAACGKLAGAVYSLPQSSANAVQVRAAPSTDSAAIQVSQAGVSAVRFSGRGFGYAPSDASAAPVNGNIAVICTSELSHNNQRVVSMTAGSVVSTTSATGACP